MCLAVQCCGVWVDAALALNNCDACRNPSIGARQGGVYLALANRSDRQAGRWRRWRRTMIGCCVDGGRHRRHADHAPTPRRPVLHNAPDFDYRKTTSAPSALAAPIRFQQP
ncbi:hypothetical protein E2C01_024129 [Portunus trituberculatus]|uniref:Uncharacterized protein n=1 Tax=Portunus trituberculatus TaxID=210409 RepID=A0A5B7EB36_PORTR|nr:hypothetical protein [Portunus trituberculatus]